MTFNDICGEIIALRFKPSELPFVKQWVNARYGMVWAAADWPFRFVGPTSLAVTANDATPTMPTDFARVSPNGLRDNNGDPLVYLPPAYFFDAFSALASTSTPGYYTVQDRTLTLGPSPSGSQTYTIAYERKVAHKDVNGNVVAGLMTEDDDEPIWDSEHHFMLVPAGMSSGLKLQNDPTWTALEDEFERLLASMMNYYIPPDQPSTRQYGADNLGYEAALSG